MFEGIRAKLNRKHGALPRHAKPRVQPDFTDVESGGLSHSRNRWHRMEAEYTGEVGAGRSAIITTDRDLHLGPAPNRINRTAFLRPFGYTAPSFQASDNPMQRAHIGHVPLIRRAALPTPRKISDDNAFVPAVYVGKAEG